MFTRVRYNNRLSRRLPSEESVMGIGVLPWQTTAAIFPVVNVEAGRAVKMRRGEQTELENRIFRYTVSS